LEHWEKKILVLLVCEGCFLFSALMDLFFGGRLHTCCGLAPREFPWGFLGLFASPFLHSDITIFLINSFPFFVLGAFVLLREDGMSTFFILTVFEIVFAGSLVWLFARMNVDHNGSSGLIMAYFGFLVAIAFVKKEARAAIIAAVVVLFYGGIIFSIIPTSTKVSYESHLFGLLAGVLVALWEGDAANKFLRDRNTAPPQEKKPLTADEVEDDDDLNDEEVDV